MSSKFFTWTKGDRKFDHEHLALRGVLSIKGNRISIDGLEFGPDTVKRGNKQKRRPLPLEMDNVNRPGSRHSSRTNDSFALQDAAVKSATCLMAAVTDMLQTPQVSAHLSVQQHHGFLSPVATRQRSHTAPSTPRHELAHPDIAELPGSFPLDENPPIRQRVSFENHSQHLPSQKTSFSALNVAHSRSQSVPFEPTPPSSGRKAHSASPLYPPSPTRDRSYRESAVASPAVHYDQPELQKAWTRRPALRVLQDDPWSGLKTPQRCCACAREILMSNKHDPSSPISSPNKATDKMYSSTENDLMERIVSIRASHEAHICSLKATHERELESHRSYISLLERSRGSGMPAQPTSERKSLTIDTSRPQINTLELHSSNTSATPLVSLESNSEGSRRLSEDSTTDVDVQKHRISEARQETIEDIDVLCEFNQLRSSAERRDRKIAQLKEILKKSKDNEHALKNAVVDLEARLEAANTQRADVNEGFHEASRAVTRLSQQEAAMKKEMAELRLQAQAKATHAEPNAVFNGDCARCRHQLDAGLDNELLPALRRIKELEKEVREKDVVIAGLEKVSMSVKEAEAVLSRVTELEASLEESREQILQVQADCDRYNTLYHHEVRRKSRGKTISTPDLALAPADINAEKIAPLFHGQPSSQEPMEMDIKASEGGASPATQSQPRENLVRKTYMPSRYRASTLGVTHDGRPRRASFNHVTSTSASGLGISGVKDSMMPLQRHHQATYPPPPTHTHIIHHVKHAPTVVPVRAKKTAVRMTEATGKRLPNLPVEATKSVVLAASLDRGESVRSLSDSIIASYAARDSPSTAPCSPPQSRVAQAKTSTHPPTLCNEPLSSHASRAVKDVPAN